MVSLGPVLRRLLPLGNGKVLLAGPHGIFGQHRMLAFPPGIQPFFYSMSDRLGFGNMTGSLQDHCLEDDEPLRVPPSIPHPLHLLPQRPEKPSPDFLTWHVIAPRWHDREVTPPRLPRRVVADASVQVRAGICVNPVSVDLLET